MATKKRIKKIMAASIAAMPMVNTLTQEEHWVKGSELIEQGHYENADGTKIDPEKSYKQMMPVCIVKNHASGMQKAFASGGQAGVTNYLRRIRSIVESN